MIAYFSGISSLAELHYVRLAEAKHILVDRLDFRSLQAKQAQWTPHLALDSGAYALHKKGTTLTQTMTIAHVADEYFKLALSAGQNRFDFVTALDIFGDAERTVWAWEYMRSKGMHEQVNLVPVWFWGHDRAILHQFLDQAQLVGIGGLVPLMREKDEAMLAELTALCAEFPGRFHLYGLRWLKALNAVRETAYSFDSSHWIAAARRNLYFFPDERSGKLREAPAQVMGVGDWSRERLCVHAVKTIEQYLS